MTVTMPISADSGAALAEPKASVEVRGATVGGGGAPWPPPSPEFLARVRHDFARRHLILSEGCVDGVEHLAAAEHAKPSAVFNVGVRLRRPVRVRRDAPEVIAAAIDRAYAGAAGAAASAAESDVPSVVVEGSGDVNTDLDAAVREAERDLLHTQGKASLYKTVSEGWRTTLGVARGVCDQYGALTGIGGNRVFRAASGVQILQPRTLASRGDLRAVPPGRYGRRPRSAAATVGCGQAEESHADDWSRPDRGVGRARIAGCAVPSLKVARFCTRPPPRSPDD